MNNGSGNKMRNDKAIGVYQAQCSDNRVSAETLHSHPKEVMGATPYPADKPRVAGHYSVQQGSDVSLNTDFEQLEGDDSPLPWPQPGSVKTRAGYDGRQTKHLDRPKITPPALIMTERVAQQIKRYIGEDLPELGGMLGGKEGSPIISEFFFDQQAKCNGAAYSPNVINVNKVLKDWNKRGIRLMGFVHSHPLGLNAPSWADEQYAERLMRHNSDMKQFFMPIVQPAVRGQAYSIHPYVCVPYQKSHYGHPSVAYAVLPTTKTIAPNADVDRGAPY